MGETLNAMWHRLSLQHELQLSPWQWVLLGALVALLVLPRPAWRLTGMYSTLVHELGHVVLALFTGRFVTGLRLGWDHSGEVVSRGRGKASVIISGVAGYPAPLWCSAGLLAATAAGYPGLALGAYAILFCLALVFVRNLAALLVCVASAALALGIVFFAPVDMFVYVALLLAGFLLVAGARDCLKLLAVHTWRRQDVRQSDAYLIGASTGTFSGIWLLVILTLAGSGLWLAVRSLILLI
ncbi:M50 family metallopeptidase [Glutamicibacter creatinolyticus]|uniref:M50 family metallopeptidase n=1 Tax=Glutamicibacter creatinolyticus TaxID=162496 RepID=UPI0031E4934E